MARRSYGYDQATGVYFEAGRRDTQREIPASSVKLDINRFALGVQLEQRDLMTRMINQQIAPQEWYDESARLMKLSYRAAVTIARGSNEEMTKEEKERWLLLALLLFLLLNKTASGLETGEIIIDGRLPIYAGGRGAALRSLYENWKLEEAKLNGYNEGRRVLGFAEHCEESEDRPGCVGLADLGWVPISEVVPIGEATCYDNCKCTLQFRKTI